MVRLTMTTATVKAIQYCDSTNVVGWPLSADGEPALDEPQTGKPISHGQIIELSKCLKEHVTGNAFYSGSSASLEIPEYHLEALLRGSKVYTEPPKPKPKPTSEYKALMARLRQEEEARSYERMLNPPAPVQGLSTSGYKNSKEVRISGRQANDEDDEMTYADINRQVAFIFNVVLSIVACSAALWMAARHWSVPSRLGLSMGGGGLVGIAEVTIYAGYLRRVSEAKEKERKKVEKKEVVETWVIERNTNDAKEIELRTTDTDVLPSDTKLRKRLATAKDG